MLKKTKAWTLESTADGVHFATETFFYYCREWYFARKILWTFDANPIWIPLFRLAGKRKIAPMFNGNVPRATPKTPREKSARKNHRHDKNTMTMANRCHHFLHTPIFPRGKHWCHACMHPVVIRLAPCLTLLDSFLRNLCSL